MNFSTLGKNKDFWHKKSNISKRNVLSKIIFWRKSTKLRTFGDDEKCVYFLYLNFKHDFLNLNKRHKSHNTCFAFHPLLRPLSNVYLRQLDVSVIPSRSLEFPFRSNTRRVSYSAEKHTDQAHFAKKVIFVQNQFSYWNCFRLFWRKNSKFLRIFRQKSNFWDSVLCQICSQAVNMT